MAMNGLMMMGWGGVEERGWRKGPWTPEEDKLLSEHVSLHGEGRWSYVARCTGLNRSGKSCRLRWVNYLKPGLKRGHLTPLEEGIIIELHALWGNRWSTIARYLPGRTDNDIKNYWRTHFKAKEKCTEQQLKRKAQILKEKQQQQLEDVDILEHCHENKKIKSANTTSTTAPQVHCEALACNSELVNDNIITTDELQDLAQAIQSCPALTSINQLGDTTIWSLDHTSIINIGSEDDQGLWGELWNLDDDRCHVQANNSMEHHASCNDSECLNRFALHQNQAMHNGANRSNKFSWDEDIHIDKVFYGGSDYIF